MFIRKYLKPFWRLLLLVIILAIVNQVFSLLDPQIYRRVLDNIVMKFSQLAHNEAIRWILIGVGWLIGVAMISRIAKNFQDYFVNVMTQKIGMQIYQETIRHAFSLPYSVFEDQSSWQLMQKLIKARTDIEAFIKNSINILFVSLVAMIFVLFYAFYVHRLIGTIYACLIPFMMLTTTTLSRRIKQAQSRIVKESSVLAWTTTESIRNVSLIKLLGLEKQEMDRLENANIGILWLELQKIKIVRTIEFIQWTLINAVRVWLLGTMFYLIYKGQLTIWEFFSLMFYSFWVINPLTQYGEVIKTYQEAKASMEALDVILHMAPQVVSANPTPVWSIKELWFEHVRFSYWNDNESTNTQKDTIKDISWHINAWETAAFVWPSWSWKSTIVKLLAWLYPANSGQVLVDKIDINNINQHEFSQRIGIVTQDTQLFNATIKENLLFIAPHATDEDIMKVLSYAHIDDLIKESDSGLQTVIWEGGIKLSGWQRQRLAIARALLRDPDILIFDEATSSLDSLIENEITETIKDVSYHKPDLITILIAHRLSTVMHADKIHVLEKWRIVEEWTHTSLLAQKGLYWALWRQQIGDDE